MPWYEDPKNLEILKNDSVREEWREWGAGQCFHTIAKKLPKEKRDKSRIGGLSVAEMEGLEGFQCWMSPIEGYPKLLSPKSFLCLIDEHGEIFFQGLWGAVTWELVERSPKFFIWLEPRSGSDSKLPLGKRLLGAFRLLKHRFNKK